MQAYRDAVLAPAQRTPERVALVAPGWTADGRAIPEIAFRRGRHNVPELAPVAAQAEVLEPSIYGGILQPEFGHFLTESVARYVDLRGTERRIVWHVPPLQERVRGWEREILAMLGLRFDPAGLILAPTRFRDIVVPAPRAMLYASFDPELAVALGVVPFAAPDPARRVWLSRSRLPADRALIEGEEALQEILAASGWTILHPETLPVRDQLAALREAAMIAGFDGSALHSLVLGADIRARIVVVPRGAVSANDMHSLIARAKGLTLFWVYAEIERTDGHGRKSPVLLRDPEAVADRLARAAAVEWNGDPRFMLR